MPTRRLQPTPIRHHFIFGAQRIPIQLLNARQTRSTVPNFSYGKFGTNATKSAQVQRGVAWIGIRSGVLFGMGRSIWITWRILNGKRYYGQFHIVCVAWVSLYSFTWKFICNYCDLLVAVSRFLSCRWPFGFLSMCTKWIDMSTWWSTRSRPKNEFFSIILWTIACDGYVRSIDVNARDMKVATARNRVRCTAGKLYAECVSWIHIHGIT